MIPPLTGRSNYIHWLQDLLDLSSPEGAPIRGLDVGTGANLIYPLLGARLCGWAFVGSDVSRGALAAAANLREANPELAGRIELRHVPMQPEQLRFFDGEGASDAVGGTHQTDRRDGSPAPSADDDIRGVGAGILSGAIWDGDPLFAFSMCNPPFFESMEEAGLNPATGFGGTELEMVYPGGEAAFVLAMARDSTTVNRRVHWFTTMVGKKATLKSLRAALQTLGVRALRTTEFSQGRTSRWAVAWSWLVPEATAQVPLPRAGAKDVALIRLGQRRAWTRQVRGAPNDVWAKVEAAVRGPSQNPTLHITAPEQYSLCLELERDGGAPPAKRARGESAKAVRVAVRVFQTQPGCQTIVARLEGDASPGQFQTFRDVVDRLFCVSF